MSEWIEFSGKNVDEALTEALIKLGTTSDKVEYEVIEKESNGILGIFAKKDARIRVKLINDAKTEVKEFLDRVLAAMEVEAEVIIEYDEEKSYMNINLEGNDMGILMGKRGQTLDSLQYLASLVVNKDTKNNYIKVKLDTENYRERRKETLENLAKNIAHKVKRTRRNVVLEPMNPYERRIIHSTLQKDKYVDTHSEGEEPYRKVVVTLKKEYADSGYGSGYRRNNNYRGGRNNRYNNNRGSYHRQTEQEKDDNAFVEQNEE